MAILFEDALKKDISSKKLSKTYLIFGDDSFLKKSYADKLSAIAYDGDEFFNLQKFEGNSNLQDVYNAVEQLPMMADSKCVCLTDFDFEKASKEDFDRLCTLLESSHDECVFILRFDNVECDAQHSTKFKSLIAATEKSDGKVIRLDHKKPVELIKVLTDGAVKRGAKMDSNTARYMVEICGSDLNTLKNELDKLCFYKKGEVIDKKTVDSVAVKSVEESVFELTKEIFNCNPTAALSLLDSLFFMRIEAIIILHTISSSYVDLYRLKTAKKIGKGISYVSEQFNYGKREFVLKRALSVIDKFDDNRLELSIKALKDADTALKTAGADERIVMEQLVIKLIYIIVKGEAVDKN
ncbi:MAG: DNA polymerase III subunit delta [Ruminococcaceae bacterium]|nr:DNA polymerase III subunit delta [Oscillospiraceae bacterium]